MFVVAFSFFGIKKLNYNIILYLCENSILRSAVYFHEVYKHKWSRSTATEDFFQFEHFWTVLDLGSSLVIKFYYKLSWILTTYAVLFIIGYFTINGYYKASSTVNHIDWLILEMFRVDEFFLFRENFVHQNCTLFDIKL